MSRKRTVPESFVDCTEGFSVTDLMSEAASESRKVKSLRKEHVEEKHLKTQHEIRENICPYCGAENPISFGKTKQGAQMFRCLDCGRTFTATKSRNLGEAKLEVKELFLLLNELFTTFAFADVVN